MTGVQQFQGRLEVATRGKGLYEISGRVADWLDGHGAGEMQMKIAVSAHCDHGSRYAFGEVDKVLSVRNHAVYEP